MGGWDWVRPYCGRGCGHHFHVWCRADQDLAGFRKWHHQTRPSQTHVHIQLDDAGLQAYWVADVAGSLYYVAEWWEVAQAVDLDIWACHGFEYFCGGFVPFGVAVLVFEAVDWARDVVCWWVCWWHTKSQLGINELVAKEYRDVC